MPSHRVDERTRSAPVFPRADVGRVVTVVALLVLGACHRAEEPDAYGNFEATETVVSAQTPGALLWFTPMEGQQVAPGNLLGVVDTAQLALERAQARAQSAAVRSRVTESGRQIEVLAVQRDFAKRAYERTRRLFAEHAATSQQLDQTEREYRTLGEQIAAARVQQQSAVGDARASDARVAQLTEQISRSRVTMRFRRSSGSDAAVCAARPSRWPTMRMISRPSSCVRGATMSR